MKQFFTRILALLCLIWGSLYAQNAGVTTIVNFDLTNCSIYSGGIPLTVRYSNFGTTNITSVPLGYQVSGGTAVSETNAVAIAGGANDTYTFTALVSLPNPSSAYTLKVWTAVPGDTDATDDTLQINFFSPATNALPFVETFENFTPQTNSSNPGILNNGWRRVTTGIFNWHVANNTTPTFSTGPIGNHTPLGSIFMFSESSSGSLGDVHKLISPCIDLGGTNGPRLSFWYHMFGAQMGTMELHIIANNDTSLAWQIVGQQQTAGADPWIEAIVDLSAYAGQVVALEYRATRGNGNNGDMAIDDIFLFDPAPVDPGVSAVITPSSPTCYGPNETITVTLQNLGSQALDLAVNPVTVGAQITGPLNNTYSTVLNTGTIPTFGSIQVDITTNADFSAVGNYTLKAYSSTAADPNFFNDTTTVPVRNLPVTVGANRETFETFSVGIPGILANNWTRTNTSNLKGWHVGSGGTPSFGTGPVGNNTATGTRYMHIEANNTVNGEEFELASSCIDVSGLLAPKLSFYYHMFGPDIGTLDVFIRNGSSNVNVFSISGPQQTGSNTVYDSALVDLLPYKNSVFQVVFRVTTVGGTQGDIALDDINIFEPPAFDGQLSRILSPESSCGLTATEPVIIEVVNGGTDTLTSIDVSFNPDATGFIPNETIPGSLFPGDTVIYTFNATANFAGVGIHTLDARISSTTPADQNGTNNDQSITVRNLGSTVTTLPYFENFEAGAGGWSSGGSNNSWAFGTPAKTTIIGAASGVNAWVTGGLGPGNYNNSEASFVVGPCFDFSNVSVPIFEMDIWWNSEFSWDGAVLESSIDGGLSWQRVGNLNDPTNWYNDNTINGLSNFNYNFGDQVGWTGRGAPGQFFAGEGSNGWVRAQRELDGLGGQGAVLLRIIFGTDFSVTDDGFAFDNIFIYEKPDFNAAADRLLSPSGGCGFDSTTFVTISYINNGTQPFDTLDVFYSVNGGPFIVEETFGLLQPGDTGFHTFSVPANMGNLAINYDVTFGTSLETDTLSLDDSLSVTLVPVAVPTVRNYPYVQDFENGQDGWSSVGTINSWAFGYPNKLTIRGAASDSNAWVTGGLGTGFHFPNEDSWVISPCLDMTSLANPQISLAIWYNCQFSADGAVLQASIDGGNTWANVGNVGDPVNWFNDNSIFGGPGGQQSGWTGRGNGTFGPGSGGWIIAKHGLTGLGGQPSVRLRVAFGSSGFTQDDGFAFDDIFIWDRATNDIAGVNFINLPRTFCDNDSARLQIEIRNDGLNTQFNFPVEVVITGPNGSDTITTNYANPIAPDGVGTVDFGFYSNSNGGTYTLKAYPSLPGDTTVFNDTLFASFQINEITAAPTAVSDSICSAGGTSFTLIAQPPSPSVRMQWFDAPVAGSVVAEGDTFITPVLNNSQVYYVEASNSENYTVGPVTFSNVSPFGGFDTDFTQGLEFDVFEDLVLESVRVFPENGGSGTIGVRIINTTTTPPVFETRTFPFSGSVADTVLTLNIPLTPATGYVISAIGTNLGPGNGLFRNTFNATYPYEEQDILSITNSTFGATSTRYYYFYNWKVRTTGCPSPRTRVDAIVQTPPVVDLGLDGAFCGSYALDVSDPDVVSYQWFKDGVPFATGPNQTIDSTGLYSILVTNTVGCTGTDSVVLTINQAPTAEVGSDSSSCDPILLTADTTGISNANYFWFSTFADNQDSSKNAYLANGSGTYILTVNALGCTAKDTVNVTIFPPPAVDLGPDRATCSDLTLDAGSGVSYQWSTGDTTQTVTLTAPFPTKDTVSVIVTSMQGCIGTDTVVVDEGVPPVINLPDSIAECDQVTLDAGNPGMSYDWSNGDSVRMITVNTSGNYAVTVTNADGCETTEDVEVEILESPAAAASYSIQPNGFTVAFNNQSTPIDSSTTFLWDFNDGSGNTSTDQNPVYTFPFPGTYLVTLEVTNRCGTSTVEVLVANVAVDAYPLDEIITLYPNPTSGEFYLRGDDLRLAELQIEVSDLRGRKIYTYRSEKFIGQLDQKVDLSDQSRGVYIVKISDGTRNVFHRVVKQ
ncbi:MAG: PKD domain-containing protein [Bacteroidia bacterium]|nr:PKD domain-containing protein [Bacteroidia bacterium]